MPKYSLTPIPPFSLTPHPSLKGEGSDYRQKLRK